MDIMVAKKSLYDYLKSYKEVVGAGIREENGSEYIVIFLSKATKKVLHKIPHEYNGKRVEVEITGVINVQ